jgi:hypothetical protein
MKNEWVMSDLKVILYKENSAPRSLNLNTRSVYRMVAFISLLIALLIGLVALSIRLYLNRGIQPEKASLGTLAEMSEMIKSGSPEDQIRSLKDEIDILQNKIKNQATLAEKTKEIDKTNPALALFAPLVVDKTKNQELVQVKNINYIPANSKGQTTVTFELHNPHPDEGTSKGYIVVLARADKNMYSYPNVFNTNGPYLLDFEKGETFAIARFRAVNAQFEIPNVPESFQVLIFTRTGELLVNDLHEIKK